MFAKSVHRWPGKVVYEATFEGKKHQPKFKGRTLFRSSSDEPTNLYILNLAFCDLLWCLFVIPLYALHFIFKGWPLGNAMCIASAVTRWAGLGITNWLLTLISFSRLVIIKSPSLGGKIFKGQAAKIPLMGVWLFCIISALEDLLSVRYNH